jgi:hypothetical protein
MKIRFLLLLLTASVQPVLSQQWTENKKDLSFQLSQEIRNYSKVYDYDGNRRPVPDMQHWVSTLEAEYGLSNSFSVGFSVPFLIHNRLAADSNFNIASTETVNKPGDAIITVRYLYPVNQNLQVSAFLQQSLATAETDAALGLNTGYADYAQNVGGTVRWNKNNEVYATFDIGYRLRHDGFGDEINALAEFGFKIRGKIWFLGRSKGVQPLENGDDAVQGGNFGLFQQYEGLWDTGAGLRYNTTKWEFTGMISGNFKGQYSPASPIYFVGVRYKIFKPAEEESD